MKQLVLIVLAVQIQSVSAEGFLVYSGETQVGRLVGWDEYYLSVLTKKRYFVRIHHNGSLRQMPQYRFSGHEGGIYYSGTGCTGDAHLGLSTYEAFPAANPKINMVVFDRKNQRTFHAPSGSRVGSVLYESYSTINFGTPTCLENNMPDTQPLPTGIKLIPNNPDITGVPNGGFAEPLIIR